MLKFAWLAMLKHSARNCRRTPFGQRRRSSAATDRRWQCPGPRTALRPSLPNWPACVAGSRRRKAERVTHASGVCGPGIGIRHQVRAAGIEAVISGELPCSATLALS